MTVEAPALVRPIGARYDRQFYTGMAIAAAVVVFVGFAPTYFLRGSYQTTSLPTYLQVHGFLFTTWIGLFIAQTSLVAVRRTNVHRRLGWAMAALAVVMVVVGTTAGIWSMRRQGDAGFVKEAQAFLTTPLFSMMAFAGFVATAIVRRRDSQIHKRLMLLAMISVLWAAFGRFRHYFPPFERSFLLFQGIVPLSMILLVMLWERLTKGKVHAVYLWVGLPLLAENLAEIYFFDSPGWQAASSWIAAYFL